MNLGHKLATSFETFGKTLDIELSYDTVLRMYDLQRDESIDETDKVDVSLRLLVKNYSAIKKAPIAAKAKALGQIFEQFIVIGKKAPQDDIKSVDFVQDARYIYASFMLDYHMDLYEQRGRLDWRKFISLFGGLSSRTKIREIIAIRTAEFPAATQHNAKAIQELQKAKAYYALDISAEEAEKNVQQGLARLFSTLSAQAIKAGETSGRR